MVISEECESRIFGDPSVFTPAPRSVLSLGPAGEGGAPRSPAVFSNER